MAVRCEFIDVIIPIANIDRVYPGGFAAFKTLNASLFGGRLWHDDYLLRDGAMNPLDAKHVVAFWEEQGLVPIETRDGNRTWRDICVVEHLTGGLTLACDWIEFDDDRRCAYLKGHAADPVVGREHFTEQG